MKMNAAWKTIDLITAAFNPSDENAEILIGYLFPRIKAQELQKRIIMWDRYLHRRITDQQKQEYYSKCDPVPQLFIGFDIAKYGQARPVLAKWWPYISEILLHPGTQLYPILARDAQIRKLLETREGQEYLKFLAQRDYEFFYRYIKYFPRLHVDPAMVGHDTATKRELVELYRKTPFCSGKIRYGKRRSETVTVWAYYCMKCGESFSEESVMSKTVKILREKKKPKMD